MMNNGYMVLVHMHTSGMESAVAGNTKKSIVSYLNWRDVSKQTAHFALNMSF